MDADRIVDQMTAGRANLPAFLMTIRSCEGTDGPDGYRTLFGGKLFDDFSAHPNVRASFKQTDGSLGFTTAAGAYQIIFSTWDRLRVKLRLPDFSPLSQDAAATELISEKNALADVLAGRLMDAVNKCGVVWASLPSSTYMQPRRSFQFAADAYSDAGGVIA